MMRGRLIRNMATGALIGAAAGMLVMPQMNVRARRRLNRAGRRIADMAQDFMKDMR